MKRYLFFFFIFLTSVSLFFSFNKIVNADTSFTFDSIYSDFYNNNFTSIKNYADNKLVTLGYSNYLIYYNPNQNTDWRYRLSVFFVNDSIRFRFDNNVFYSVGNISGTLCYLNINNLSEMSCNTTTYSNYPFPLMYSTSSLSLTCPTSYGILTFTNGTDIYNISCSAGEYSSFPTYVELLNLWNSTPSDDTPVLTSFIDLVIDRLSYICDFFTSSYIYLSVFVILILYISILLLRRLQNV